MSLIRLPWYVTAVLFLLACGYALAILGLALCSPPPLPGDAWWAWTTRLNQAVATAFGNEPRCFLRTAAGQWSLRLASWSGPAALALVALAVFWETAGRRARREFRRMRGGHAILAGEPGEIESLVAGKMPIAFIMRNRAAAQALGRPFADVSVLGDRRRATGLLERLGGSKASFIAAVTANDLANGELAEAALSVGGKGEVLVRVENASVRALKSDVLRRAAENNRRSLTVISLRQIQARQALHQAMPGRFRDAAAARIHVAICGAGPMMQEMAVLTAQQGYGLDSALPLLSIIRTGRNDFAAGALERLAAAEAVEVVAAFADGDDAVAIDRVFSAVALTGTPLAAVHCCGEEEGAALALALRLERVFVDLGIPIPPIVVHDGGSDTPGDTGMVRNARAPNLIDARNYAALVDQRTLAFHAAYLDGQRAARGTKFGTLPAECEWSVLSEQFRDDNRSSADHIDYKLARTGFVPAKRAGGAGLTDADIETLAALEHARWMARRSLAGWRHAPVRDNGLLRHPDMKPYAEQDEDAKRKDREQVALVTVQLSRGGEALARLDPFALLSAAGAQRAVALLAARLRSDPLVQPIVAVALETPDAISIAEAAFAARLPVEAFVAAAPEQAFADPDLRRRAAAILRQAWIIRIVRGEKTAVTQLAAEHRLLVDAEGRLHEAVLA